jgi:hypothetical protein
MTIDELSQELGPDLLVESLTCSAPTLERGDVARLRDALDARGFLLSLPASRRAALVRLLVDAGLDHEADDD